METMCLKTGIVPSISIGGSLETRATPTTVSAVARSTGDKQPSSQKSLFSRFSFRYPLESLWSRGGSGNRTFSGLSLDDAVLADNNGEMKSVDGDDRQRENWVLKILHVKSVWKGERGNQRDEEETSNDQNNDDDDEVCDTCIVDDDEKEDEFEIDRDSFSKMLRRVSLGEARLYAQMSHLGSLAYSIPNIKPGKLLKHYGLRFVTSSLEKKELAAKSEKNSQEVEVKEKSEKDHQEVEVKEKQVETKEPNNGGYRISAATAYNIAASAASYLHTQTRSILPFKSSNAAAGEENNESLNMMNTEVASLMATTDSVTAVVAAKEEVKQAVADDLNSTRSSPCEWFICDDNQSGTRFFVIQGSESLASWQANLLFEPVKFEGLDVLVHRGIYEAAKGIYLQMLPEVQAHLKSRGSRATFRFTGHSLGGSLALLVNLMLFIREDVPISSLLPVITFGSPSIMCGGDTLLDKLGLPRSHVQAIMMHRDIVPRAFSCNYPDHVAKILKAINANFRNHPCLNNQKLLYTPMGELLILQPDEKFSPSHDLLPQGSGLYLLCCPLSEPNDIDKKLRAAQLMFLNTPHPLEILSDRSAYGSGGNIQRDHDMSSYLKTVRSVIRQELNQIRKSMREKRRKVWWPLVLPRRVDTNIVVGKSVIAVNIGQRQSPFTGMMKTGKESLKRFSRLVASQHMHLFVLLFFPARMLLLGAYSLISVR
ncbi:phospholipase A1 PLIP2, chloroplastic [Trifolium pratense]|uniref:phospholipase A1 PLIP2, chloroplastic n=1 Tax=Trifolium pratense TaxID=57577 RepID=UPI001E6940D9|nr:phospholipase A1 PLIP2, chloroplastic [Trifolium pratense]